MDKIREIIIRELEESAGIKKLVAQALPEAIAEAAQTIINAYQAGNKLLLIGNGGSAADAQHIATEFVGRFLKVRKALAAIALTTDTSILTAVSNDQGFETVFSRQIEALAQEGDVLLAMTTSGASPNILKAMETARAKGMKIIVLTGEKGKTLKGKGDVVIIVPSAKTPRIQEAHITIGHIICYLVEKELFGEAGSIS
jgi:D-sedoheptulose 7-phosphate isomerase